MSNPLYEQVTARVIAELEKGAAPWVKPWRADMTADRNLVSSKPYRGVNRFILGLSSMAAGYGSPVWATFKQWQEAGGSVRKGEKATHICFYKPVQSTDKETGETANYSVLKSYCVFNLAQVDGVTLPGSATVEPEFVPHEKAELTLLNSGAMIQHGSDAAFYAPGPDMIKLPNKSAFADPASYYATGFHELTHWTGHKNRLDRDLSGKFGNPAYAFEELVAEMGAAFLCADHGLQGELRHAGYIASWLKCLRENDQAIFKAAALAQKAADFIMQQTATEDAIAA